MLYKFAILINVERGYYIQQNFSPRNFWF